MRRASLSSHLNVRISSCCFTLHFILFVPFFFQRLMPPPLEAGNAIRPTTLRLWLFLFSRSGWTSFARWWLQKGEVAKMKQQLLEAEASIKQTGKFALASSVCFASSRGNSNITTLGPYL
jgi:hypothetical protein